MSYSPTISIILSNAAVQIDNGAHHQIKNQQIYSIALDGINTRYRFAA
jgi:hypothetical protein